ncbi:hypothetical protein SARC_13900 [Sphaeroforma arctica JP610]|uniref:F-box domain-containing protein n=1 Tax=Sphaeroforma arctica JP610 TaxID=667725 RepID=A0A0L0F9Z8_9EUKA|nr:hypothetical protein SARC_13900 [Sphaeroforma arctica JP610]KNC73540.1 hypothetical protein SARC_13900 [Sphaeroforma arctica JP610]|eukprot:XP_014147442.1 hypothetical protein SARC_13900 [Sphaeroforma arctica JP610]
MLSATKPILIPQRKKLLDLPSETMGLILSNISVEDLQKVLLTSHTMRNVATDCLTGTDALIRDFQRFEKRKDVEEGLCVCCERQKSNDMLDIIRVGMAIWGVDVVVEATARHHRSRLGLMDENGANVVTQILVLIFQSACTLSSRGLSLRVLELFSSRATLEMALNRGCVMDCPLMVHVLLCRITDLTSEELSAALNQACWAGSSSVVELLLSKSDVDPSVDNSTALSYACAENKPDIVRLLLQDIRMDPAVIHFGSFLQACKHGYVRVVKLMLDDGRLDPSVQQNEAFIQSSLHGCCEVTQLLLTDTRVDPAARHSWALRKASLGGTFRHPGFSSAVLNNTTTQHYIKIVQLLLEDGRADPSAHDNDAFIGACDLGLTEIAELLIRDNRVDPTARNNRALLESKKKGYDGLIQLLGKDERVAQLVTAEEKIGTCKCALDKCNHPSDASNC